jgi:hypothetical protein
LFIDANVCKGYNSILAAKDANSKKKANEDISFESRFCLQLRATRREREKEMRAFDSASAALGKQKEGPTATRSSDPSGSHAN